MSTIARTPSRESLAVHPLLNTHPDPKYVPYTPRQRQATLPTPNQPSKLRAAAQNIGLEANSIGWAILDKIAYEGDTSDDWSEIWNALTKAKATLLLPVEPTSAHDTITPEFVQDHVVLCDLASRENTAVVTLSGLRGHLVGQTLTFRSTLHRSTKPFQSLWAPLTSRAASLDALPPLPVYPPESSYPSFAVASFGALPIPLRATKPHLPPRPGSVRGTSTPTPARLPMPFASLFGRPSTPPPPTPSTASPSTDVDAVTDISVHVIDTAVLRTDIATGIISALNGEIAIALNDYPPWIVERVHTFSLPYLPFVKVPAGKKKLQDIGGTNRVVYGVNHALDKPEDLADKFQTFYRAVEGELRSDASVQRDEEVDETRIRDVLETIESTLCTLLYDRLFLPWTSDDASHNEALSSRIAALNMLDLGLEHLDIALGGANHAEVDAVVRTCGQALTQLDFTARSPREKAAVLVTSHKLVVEGLSRIPPIRLKSRDDKEGSGHELETVVSAPPLEPSEKQSPSVPTIHLSTSPEQLSALKRPPATEPAPSSPVSGDVLLPILIFSVVKANPSRLVSHLLFTQRFRNQSFGGEESYCLINLMAVAEFLENVDLTALGLGESAKKVLSTADLTPIPIARPSSVPESPIAAVAVQGSEEHMASLRGRVEQGVDAIAGSANKVILGVVDSSFGVLRALLPQGQNQTGSRANGAPGPLTSATSGSGSASGSGRRETSFSIAGLTAAFPSGPSKTKNQHTEQEGQRELVEVSSLKSHLSVQESESADSEASSEEGEDESGDEEGAAEGEGEGEGEGEEEEIHDARSIKSFESMLSSGRTRVKMTSPLSSTSATGPTRRRKRLSDLTDRLTHGVAGISKRVTVQGGDATHRAQHQGLVTLSGRLPPPNRRFVECTEQDIRVTEVGELLRDYQRLVEAVRSVGGFQE